MKLNLHYSFDAAHRLEFHKGKCFNLHGHRFNVEIELTSLSLDDMIIDFGELKKVIDKYDHSCILKDCKENKKLIDLLLLEMQMRVILLDCSPTAENLSRIIWKDIRDLDKDSDSIDKIKVTIFESPNSSISYEE